MDYRSWNGRCKQVSSSLPFHSCFYEHLPSRTCSVISSKTKISSFHYPLTSIHRAIVVECEDFFGTMASGTVSLLCLLVFIPYDSSLARPSGKLRPKRQAAQSSALAALMSFSVKLSDMERQITSYDRKIQRQSAEINQLSAKLDNKADRSQFRDLTTLLNSKMTTVKGVINTKELVIERYRNHLRNLEGEISEVRNEYNKLVADTAEVLNRFDDTSLHCTTRKARWGPKANGSIMYLERQRVRCYQNEFLQSFYLSLASNYEEDMVRYVYRCCSVTI